METIVVYSSQTGFTKKYAHWLAKALEGNAMPLEKALKKTDDFFEPFDAIIYGGWAVSGKVNKSAWFTDRIDKWKGKKLAIFCVGASPNDSPHADEMIGKLLTEEQKEYAKAFYCQGGLDYDKMSLGSKLAMKAYAAFLKKRKNQTEDEKQMAEMVSKSYDISDPKYIAPIVEYIGK
ncbi:MAG: flavodoxin [Ruminococcus sp.]|nr:flavodoxin [Ruminococcus sp.]